MTEGKDQDLAAMMSGDDTPVDEAETTPMDFSAVEYNCPRNYTIKQIWDLVFVNLDRSQVKSRVRQSEEFAQSLSERINLLSKRG